MTKIRVKTPHSTWTVNCENARAEDDVDEAIGEAIAKLGYVMCDDCGQYSKSCSDDGDDAVLCPDCGS